MSGNKQSLSLSLTSSQAEAPGVFLWNDPCDDTAACVVNYCRFSKCQKAQIVFSDQSGSFDRLEKYAEDVIACINALAGPGEEFAYEFIKGPVLKPGEDDCTRFRFVLVNVTRKSKK